MISKFCRHQQENNSLNTSPFSTFNFFVAVGDTPCVLNFIEEENGVLTGIEFVDETEALIVNESYTHSPHLPVQL